MTKFFWGDNGRKGIVCFINKRNTFKEENTKIFKQFLEETNILFLNGKNVKKVKKVGFFYLNCFPQFKQVNSSPSSSYPEKSEPLLWKVEPGEKSLCIRPDESA